MLQNKAVAPAQAGVRGVLVSAFVASTAMGSYRWGSGRPKRLPAWVVLLWCKAAWCEQALPQTGAFARGAD